MMPPLDRSQACTSAVCAVFAACLVTSCDPREQEARITAQDFRFVPAQVRLAADAPIRLTIVNEGREPHEFASSLLTDAQVVVLSAPQTLRILPGRSVTFMLQAPPGTYLFRCPIRGHAGMNGVMIVE